MASSTARATGGISSSGSIGSSTAGFFGQQVAGMVNKANRNKWNKMDDTSLRALYDKGGARSQGAFAEIQRRQTLGNFGMQEAGGNNVVGGDSDNRLVDIESRLANLEGGGTNLAEEAGVGGNAIASGGFDDAAVGIAEGIYGTEEEKMSAAGSSMMNNAAISGL